MLLTRFFSIFVAIIKLYHPNGRLSRGKYKLMNGNLAIN